MKTLPVICICMLVMLCGMSSCTSKQSDDSTYDQSEDDPEPPIELNTRSLNNNMLRVYTDEVFDGNMRYIVFQWTNGGVCIINTTKDSLEVELIRKQLDNLLQL